MAKTWDDQPDEVENAVTLGSFTITAHDNRRESHHGQVELRVFPNAHEPQHWYLTAGNLFGSQTVKCESAAVVLNVLCNIGKTKQPLPSGAVLVEKSK